MAEEKKVKTVDIGGTEATYQDLTIDDIILWCQLNNQIAWLKEEAAKKTPYKKYPRVKGEDGKYHADKTAEPEIEERPISFIQLKINFVHKFLPEIAPDSKEKKVTFHELIKNLKQIP